MDNFEDFKKSKSYSSLNKKFCILFFVIFFILGSYLSKQNIVFSSLLFLLVYLINPCYIGLLTYIWLKIGFYLSKILNPILLFLLYYFVFTLFSIFLKLTNRDFLRIKSNKYQTNWNKKEKNRIVFEEQF